MNHISSYIIVSYHCSTVSLSLSSHIKSLTIIDIISYWRCHDESSHHNSRLMTRKSRVDALHLFVSWTTPQVQTKHGDFCAMPLRRYACVLRLHVWLPWKGFSLTTSAGNATWPGLAKAWRTHRQSSCRIWAVHQPSRQSLSWHLFFLTTSSTMKLRSYSAASSIFLKARTVHYCIMETFIWHRRRSNL